MRTEGKLDQINADASQHCSDALSKLVHKKMEVEFSKPVIADITQVSPLVGSQELGVGIYLTIAGGVTGSCLFLFSHAVSLSLCDLITRRGARHHQELSSFDKEVLKEIGNILLGNYLTVLSNRLDREIIGGLSHFSSGMFGAILEEVVVDFSKNADKAMVIRIELTIGGIGMKGYVLLLLRASEVEAVLNSL